MALGRADGLLDGGEVAFEDARARQLLDIAQQARLEAGERFEFLADEEIVGPLDAFGPDDLRLLDIAAEVEVVGALLRDRDAHPRAIDVAEPLDRRAGRDEIGGGNLKVRRGELYFLRALRLRAEEAHVPGSRSG